MMENFVFVYIGVSVFNANHHWDVAFVIIAIVACMASRVISIYPMSLLINCCRGHFPTVAFRQWRGTARAATTNGGPAVGGNGSSAGAKGYNRFDVPTIAQATLPTSSTSASATEPRSSRGKITLSMQHMLSFSGVRGAMAFALALQNTSSETRRILFSATTVIVLVTVLLCGGLTAKMLKWLHIR